MNNESIEITDEAIEDFVDGGPKPPGFHTILKVWNEVLKPLQSERGEKVTAGFAQRICTQYREVTYAMMNAYRDLYFDRLERFQEILLAEIESDPECLTYTTPEEDLEHNSQHYKQLLLDWQLELVQWEKDWDCESQDAPIQLAVISEIHKMFFAQDGLVAFLESIQFQFTEHDQAEMQTALQELKDRKDDRE